MDEEDFRALIALLEQQLRDVGAADIADERHYFHPDSLDGETRLLDPEKRLVEMLRAFNRLLTLQDRNLYRYALARMNDALRGDGPKRAVFELAREAGRGPVVVDLGDAPDLGELREATNRLIGQLLESRLPPRSLA